MWVTYRLRLRLAVRMKLITLDVEALVDTGATLTVIPRSIAKTLNLRIAGRSSVITGGGEVELDRSRAWLEILGRRDIVPELISDSLDKVLIGSQPSKSSDSR